MYEFLRQNKKWWITPAVVVILVLAGITVLSATTPVPFIYTVF
ncbi:MAG: DUF5989 family protein [Byssovorax sp.]